MDPADRQEGPFGPVDTGVLVCKEKAGTPPAAQDGQCPKAEAFLAHRIASEARRKARQRAKRNGGTESDRET